MKIVNSTLACTTVPLIQVHPAKLKHAQGFPKFPGHKVRFSDWTFMFFTSGRFNILGLKRLDLLDIVEDAMTEYLSSCCYPVAIKIRVANVVFFESYNGRINLRECFSMLKDEYKCVLELEFYPALRVHNGWCALIYQSGKIIVTGTTEVEKSLCHLTEIVHKCMI